MNLRHPCYTSTCTVLKPRFTTSRYQRFLIWVGFLGFRFEVCVWGGGGDKINPCLKLVRIMLETLNLTRKYTHICSSREYTFSTKVSLILLMSAFFGKKSAVFAQKYIYSKQYCESCVRDFFSSVFSFCKMKGYLMKI